ncbi:TPA: hypothetical protein ACIBS5_000521 [Salmonella enterica subsp. diarizonae serovar 60-67:z35:-]
MELPKEFMMHAGQPLWLPREGEAVNYGQSAPQPVQPVQPVYLYAMQPAAAAQPQPQKYVFLPWMPSVKNLNDAESPQVRALLQERLDTINVVIDRLNEAGVPWVNVNTGKDHNGVQVLPAIETKEPAGKNDSGNNQPSPHEAL